MSIYALYMLFTILNLPDIKGTALFGGLERVPIINPPFADISPLSNQKSQGQHRGINPVKKQTKFGY